MFKLWHILGLVGIVKSIILNSNSDLERPWLERNKINKGIWLRNKHQNDFEKASLSNFLFTPDSQDSDNIVRNVFDVQNSRQDGLLGFFERSKRSPHSQNKHRNRKSLNNKTRITSKPLPSIFSDDPYVAVLIDSPNNKNIDYTIYPKYQTVMPEDNIETSKDTKNIISSEKNEKKEYTIKGANNSIEYFTDVVNVTTGNVSTPKRSMNYGSDIERINFLEDLNKSKETQVTQTAKEERMWQTAPVPEVPREVAPKDDIANAQNIKPVSERGLIRVLSMLTKTFRKIMKHHNDIKAMHADMQGFNEDFKKIMETHTKKIEDFDIKYAFFLKIIEKLKALQEKLKSKEEICKKKDEEMSNNLIQFERQQKKFLAQQQQFYNMQKLMLAQNEKISQNQNQIAKTQNEISHRQNNFARVLKKAKQMYMENKTHKLTTAIVKPKENIINVTKEKNIDRTTATTSSTTESVKINLFSIAPSDPIENQDHLILKEKDEKPIDDLIYKYYFNNTFIDSFIKNKLLLGVYNGDKRSMTRNAKMKRNKHYIHNHDAKLNITIMLPVYNETRPNVTLHRERRWINHHSKRKHRRKQRGKGQLATNKPLHLNNENDNNISAQVTIQPKDNSPKDPFLLMATNFCNEIGQNTTKQILGWCIEKSLRRLKGLDTKMVPALPPMIMKKAFQTTVTASSYLPTEAAVIIAHTPDTSTSAPEYTKSTTVLLTTETSKSQTKPDHEPTVTDSNPYFPDNDELESNLKQFDLTKDTVGTYYYDGSLHESDLIGDKSEPESDLLPEFDSNSRVDIDTRILELQAKRRYHVKRMKANQLKKNGK